MTKKKKDTIKSLALHAKDVGSTEIQIGLLTDKILKLSDGNDIGVWVHKITSPYRQTLVRNYIVNSWLHKSNKLSIFFLIRIYMSYIIRNYFFKLFVI